MFLREIQAQHWIRNTLSLLPKKKKRQHQMYLDRMATATEYSYMDMPCHVDVRYDVSMRAVVWFMIQQNSVVPENIPRCLWIWKGRQREGLQCNEGLLADFRRPQERNVVFDSLHDERRCTLPVSGIVSHISHLCVNISQVHNQVLLVIPISHTTRPSPLSVARPRDVMVMRPTSISITFTDGPARTPTRSS